MIFSYDFIVLGSGLAGLNFALDVAEHGSVAVVTKRGLSDSNTNWAQGGIAAVSASDDSFSMHIADTLSAGAGLCKEEIVRLCVEEGPTAIRRLEELGVRFSRKDDGESYDLGREGGHTRRRVLHVDDFTGRKVQSALAESARRHRNIHILENHTAIDLIMKYKMSGDRRDRICLGVYAMDKATGEVKTITAPVTCLATGGAGKVYLYTSNPDAATGDGVAMAARAGARVANMEFYQFHPTCLYHPKAKSFLISEALRGEGGVLKRINGQSFMEKYHPMASLAPRDIVARAIDTELKASGEECVLLDMSAKSADFIRHRFPNIHAECLKYGIDISSEPIPVVPAAHFLCGGVITDLLGRTDIGGLYACGEVACSGLHGANRLASNSLLEAAVMSMRAARDARSVYHERINETLLRAVPMWDTGRAVPSDELVVVSHIWDEIRRFMWNFVGIARTSKRLERAERRIGLIRQEVEGYYWKYNLTADFVELRNIALVAELIIRSALLRRESRGLHFNTDYPFTDDENYRHDTII
ncbi:MAG: L-aspartate oxidase [Myxococcales bacterium]|nr:MAG: L-aspartate oxidase [Myxococcales bacterium]